MLAAARAPFMEPPFGWLLHLGTSPAEAWVAVVNCILPAEAESDRQWRRWRCLQCVALFGKAEILLAAGYPCVTSHMVMVHPDMDWCTSTLSLGFSWCQMLAASG